MVDFCLIYGQGRAAQKRAVSANPHPAGSSDHAAWRAGWEAANAYDVDSPWDDFYPSREALDEIREGR